MAKLSKRIFACLSILCLVNIINGSSSNKTTFDQRQTGEYNIQISLKDIKIFALLSGGLGGSEDYDYNYDYSELTIKPPSGNKTTTPTSTTFVTTPSEPSQSNAESTTERVVEITPATLSTSSISPVPSTNGTKIIDTSNTTDSKNQTTSANLTSAIPSNQTVSSTTFRPLTIKPDYTTGIPVKVIVTPLERVPNNKRGSDDASADLSASLASYFNNGTKLQRADCMNGFRKDRQGNCRPRSKKPQQQTLLRKLIQLSQRFQPARQRNSNNNNN